MDYTGIVFREAGARTQSLLDHMKINNIPWQSSKLTRVTPSTIVTRITFQKPGSLKFPDLFYFREI